MLIALGPMSIAVAYLASVWCERRRSPRGCCWAILIVVLGTRGQPGGRTVAARALGVAAARIGRGFLARREPTFTVGRWAARNLPATARLIGQDHRGFYIPRDYTMELAHRRRTGLGGRGESPARSSPTWSSHGFTHVMFCPPVPETAVEFDPTLGRLLAPWTAGRDAALSPGPDRRRRSLAAAMRSTSCRPSRSPPRRRLISSQRGRRRGPAR